MNPYRLSLDIGTNSIGWCALKLETIGQKPGPVGILDMGVRIYSDGRNPKDGSSNAAKRRMARSMRRNRDRFLERRDKLIRVLVEAGLMPEDEMKRRKLTLLDPYELRARGLGERLEPHEFGRAIFHLNQRRGFRSNRKSDAGDKEAGLLKEAIRQQGAKMEEMGARTFGKFLFLRREKGLPVRSRVQFRPPERDSKKKKPEEFYEFYPSRDEIENEFDQLWNEQSKSHPELLTATARERIHNCIFYQRPLKPPVVGRCALVPEEERLPWASPLAQQLRIYQELNNMGVISAQTLERRDLTIEERDKLATLLCRPRGIAKGKAEVSFDKLRDQIDPNGRIRFTLESDKRKKLLADSTSALLSHKSRFGARWYDFSDEDRENIVAILLHENDEEALLKILEEDWGLDREQAEKVSSTALPDGHSRRGRTAAEKILAELKRDLISESEAVVQSGYPRQSILGTGSALDRLPYYGEVLERHVIPDPKWAGHPAAKLEQKFGKVANPTVHIALNQLRRVVNEVIKLYGRPAEIHVEVLRELKNSIARRQEIEREQAANKERNDEIVRRLRDEFHVTVNRENIQRLRLWNEVEANGGICVYSGEVISPRVLFTEAVEIDHILPRSRTLDDGMANKVLCLRHANRGKSNQTPFEAWGSSHTWDDVVARSKLLPANKRWRFAADAMERFAKDNDFLSRHLTDSQYIASLARGYLATLYETDKSHKVVCLPGRLTGMFRHHLGLSSILEEINPALAESPLPKGEKNRNDHRHHAVDALVVGLMDRAFLQRAARTCARFEKEGVYEFLEGFDAPWPRFRTDAREALARIIVSYKPDHGVAGELHNQTAYGIARNDPRGQAVHRVNVDSLKPGNILQIKGRRLRAELVVHLTGRKVEDVLKLLEYYDDRANSSTVDVQSLMEGLSASEGALARATQFLKGLGIRRVRIVERIELKKVKDRHGREYKGFKPDSNAYLQIFENTDGSGWSHGMVATFDANRSAIEDASSADGCSVEKGRPVTRLFNRDIIELEHDGERRIFYVQRLSDKQITLAEHFEANTDGRNRSKQDPFKFVYKGSAEALRKAGVRFLVVTPAGRIRYLSGKEDDSESD